MTASGSSTSDRAVGDRVTAGRVTPERAVAVSAIRLMQGVVYQESDAWDDLIEHWLTHEIRTVSDGFPDYGNSRTESVPRQEPLRDVSVGEILEEAIGLEPARWTRGDQMRVSAYLKANGWERYRRRDEGGREAPREWRYRRGSR